ncbi:unnamed protein product [Prunus armeniaca]
MPLLLRQAYYATSPYLDTAAAARRWPSPPATVVGHRCLPLVAGHQPLGTTAFATTASNCRRPPPPVGG